MAGMIQPDASWNRLVNRYKNVARSNPIRQDGLILWAMQEGQKEAINQANIAIYNKPVRGNYQRTGNLKKAIKTRKVVRGADAGEVYLDASVASNKGFYYPKLREGPPEGWKSSRNYPQDPYWHNTRLIMRARMQARARQTLKEYQRRIQVG